MKRREFIALLGGASAAWPIAGWAQQGGSQATIGMMVSSGTAAGQSQNTAAFVRRLSELGWVEGRNLVIEYRWAGGRNERLSEIADEFVRLKVDVIVTHSTPPLLAAKQGTTTIPIVFATAGDPVGTGIVASLAHPGGNITGLSSQIPETSGKRLELLREFIPRLRQLAIFLAPVAAPGFTTLEGGEIQKAGRSLDIETVMFEIRGVEDIAPAFAAFQGRADALYVGSSPLLSANINRIANLALVARLPSISASREYVEVGSLMSYAGNGPDIWRRAANLVDKILRGANPGEIPIQQPTKFDLIVNLKTAKALGLDVPPILLASADEVIE
jgi:putative ABC transport system substrate-binding protein